MIMNKGHLWLIVAVLAGVVLAARIREIPVIGAKIPTV